MLGAGEMGCGGEWGGGVVFCDASFVEGRVELSWGVIPTFSPF